MWVSVCVYVCVCVTVLNSTVFYDSRLYTCIVDLKSDGEKASRSRQIIEFPLTKRNRKRVSVHLFVQLLPKCLFRYSIFVDKIATINFV